MKKYNLKFISDENIFNHVKNTVQKYRFDIDLQSFNKNLIDPIKMTFDSKIYKKSIEETIENEIVRQMDKSNANEIGYFHQNIFRYIGSNWVVLERGFDVINENEHFFVEMKNKHNTMNSSSSLRTYERMKKKIEEDKRAICALVEVIAKKSGNEPWEILIDGKPSSNERIRKISIDKFYELVTGKKHSFKNLCEKLPIILEDVLNSMENRDKTNTVLAELKKISPNLLKSIYRSSFKKYEGFDKFNI